MTTIPKVVPPLSVAKSYKRDVPITSAFEWLRKGWADLATKPGPSLVYGSVIFAVSAAIVVSLYLLALDYILFPALAGFLVVGPLLAMGLYEKSRCIARSEKPTIGKMIFVRPQAGGQVLFTGALLCLLMLFWMRAAVLLYALFYGLRPFPGLEEIVPTLFATPTGWSLLVVGTLVGGLFAAFSFAISVFSVPMLLEQRTDALTAMGTSMALVWHNLPVMVVWGAIVLVLTIVGVALGLVGLVVIFPLLGHASWHAAHTMCKESELIS